MWRSAFRIAAGRKRRHKMAMRVEDFYDAHDVASITDLESALNKRYGQGVNSFWLSHAREKGPVISLLVKGDLATLTYFPGRDHPGFTSIGKMEGLNPDENTILYLDNPDQAQEIPNTSIVPFSTALEVSKEFFNSRNLPTAIQWFEL